MSPEARARQKIDALLVAAGWAILDYKQLNLGVGSGIAVREVALESGPCDYLLLVDLVPIGVIEAATDRGRLPPGLIRLRPAFEPKHSHSCAQRIV